MPTIELEDCPSTFSSWGKPSTGLPRQPGFKWYVAQVKSRQDRVFVQSLCSQKISFFIPQQLVKTRAHGTEIETMKLVMPGFVFVLCPWEDLHRLWDTRRVWNILKTNDQSGLRQDLRRFAAFIKSLLFMDVRDTSAIQAGRRVRFINGHSLQGMEAFVDSRVGNRVLLDIHMVGCASFQCDPKYLEVI